MSPNVHPLSSLFKPFHSLLVVPQPTPSRIPPFQSAHIHVTLLFYGLSLNTNTCLKIPRLCFFTSVRHFNLTFWFFFFFIFSSLYVFTTFPLPFYHFFFKPELKRKLTTFPVLAVIYSAFNSIFREIFFIYFPLIQSTHSILSLRMWKKTNLPLILFHFSMLSFFADFYFDCLY